MDSLNNLRDSLDSSSSQAANDKTHENRLTADFKAAALHLTALYRTSLASTRAARDSGYIQALTDILDVVHSRSSPCIQSQEQGGGGHTLAGSIQDDAGPMDDAQRERAWLARYLRARLDTMRLEEEGEDTADDMENAQGPAPANPTSSSLSAASTAPRGMSASSPMVPTSALEDVRPITPRGTAQSPSLFTFRSQEFLTRSPTSSETARTGAVATVTSSPLTSLRPEGSLCLSPSRPAGNWNAKARTLPTLGASRPIVSKELGRASPDLSESVATTALASAGGRPTSLSPVLEEQQTAAGFSHSTERERRWRNPRVTRTRPALARERDRERGTPRERDSHGRDSGREVSQRSRGESEAEREDRGGRRRGAAMAEEGEERSRKKRRDRATMVTEEAMLES